VAGIGHRVAELDVVVHAAAERLVLRVAATAQGVVLARGSLVAGDNGTVLID